MKIAAVILAAGQGTRMKSALPKVLQQLGGRPLVRYAAELAQAIGVAEPVFVVGHGLDAVQAAVGGAAQFVVQAEQLGTGHAALQAAALLRESAELVLVWYADMPLLRPETLHAVVAAQQANRGPLTILTATADDARGFGRVLRDPKRRVRAVVEEAHATRRQLAMCELNAGVYCARADWLWKELARLPASPKGEYYLTDLVGVAVAQRRNVASVQLSATAELIGINTREHLAEAETALRLRINQQWMAVGVHLLDPASTYIEPGVQLAPECVILPNTHLCGTTSVGAHSTIGPNSVVRDSAVGANCRIECSVIESAVVEEDVRIGPFAHLRPGAHLARGVHMGNFGEVKNSYLGPEVKMGHFSYIGDAQIGARTNIGAGTITCNFGMDQKKHRTVVGDDAYIGSDTLLVAPVTIGKRGRTGAGSVVTHDIPADALAVGVPARVIKRTPPQGKPAGDT